MVFRAHLEVDPLWIGLQEALHARQIVLFDHLKDRLRAGGARPDQEQDQKESYGK